MLPTIDHCDECGSDTFNGECQNPYCWPTLISGRDTLDAANDAFAYVTKEFACMNTSRQQTYVRPISYPCGTSK